MKFTIRYTRLTAIHNFFAKKYEVGLNGVMLLQLPMQKYILTSVSKKPYYEYI